jgi:CBS domain-containing protein
MGKGKLESTRTVVQKRGRQAREVIVERAPEVKGKLVETASDLRQRLAEALATEEIPEPRRKGMLGKLFNKFTLGLAAGYVLGARAGRERYQQIKSLVGQATEKTGLGGGMEGPLATPHPPQSIREVMTAAPETVQTSSTVAEAARKMREIDAGAMVVVDDQGKVSGIVTDRDIAVRAVAEGKDPAATKVGEVASTDLIELSPADTVGHALQLMTERAVRRLPVVESGKAVGIVSIGDLAVERDRTSALAHISAAPPSKK